MIGKVAPIMTFEMLMRKFIDEWESGTSSKDPKPLKAAESDPWVIRKELNELGIESPGSSKDIS
jgi:hypothetical protein